MSLTTQKQQLTKHQLPPISKQLNILDSGLLMVLDAANLVQHSSPGSTKYLPPPNELRRHVAADLFRGSLYFTKTKNADPNEVCRTIINDCIDNNDVEASYKIGPVLDNIAVTKEMLQHFLRDERLTISDMNAPLQMLRDEVRGNNTIAILCSEFCERAERSVTDKTVAPNYLKWMLESHGPKFDYAQVQTVWMPIYLPVPNEANREFAHWRWLRFHTSSSTFSRGCSLGKETQSKYAQESAAKAFLMNLTEVYIPPCHPSRANTTSIIPKNEQMLKYGF